MTIGNRIRRARKYANLSQRELGIALGFNLDTAEARVSQYERGARIPRADVIEKLSHVLQVPKEYFLLPTPAPETSNAPAFLFQLEQGFPFSLCHIPADGETPTSDIYIRFEDGKTQEFLREWMYMHRNLREGYIDEHGYFRWQMDTISKLGREDS